MKKTSKTLSFLMILALGLGAGFLVGCEREEGPAEELGESIDDAVDELKDDGENLGDKIGDAVDELKDEGEDLGDELKDAGEELKDGVEDAADDVKDAMKDDG